MPKKTVRKTNPKAPVKTTSPETQEAKQKNILSFYPVKFKTILVVAILIILGLLWYFKGLFIAASVNGQMITRLELIRELEKKGGKQVLESLVNKNLILQEAKKKNVQVTDKEINDEVKKIEDNLSKQGQKLNDVLQLQGISREDFIDELKTQKIIEKLLASKAKVTDAEVKDYIEKNKESLGENVKTEDVKEQLRQQKLRTEFQTWLQDIQKKAKISYFVNF